MTGINPMTYRWGGGAAVFAGAVFSAAVISTISGTGMAHSESSSNANLDASQLFYNALELWNTTVKNDLDDVYEAFQANDGVQATVFEQLVDLFHPHVSDAITDLTSVSQQLPASALAAGTDMSSAVSYLISAETALDDTYNFGKNWIVLADEINTPFNILKLAPMGYDLWMNGNLLNVGAAENGIAQTAVDIDDSVTSSDAYASVLTDFNNQVSDIAHVGVAELGGATYLTPAIQFAASLVFDILGVALPADATAGTGGDGGSGGTTAPPPSDGGGSGGTTVPSGDGSDGGSGASGVSVASLESNGFDASQITSIITALRPYGYNEFQIVTSMAALQNDGLSTSQVVDVMNASEESGLNSGIQLAIEYLIQNEQTLTPDEYTLLINIENGGPVDLNMVQEALGIPVSSLTPAHIPVGDGGSGAVDGAPVTPTPQELDIALLYIVAHLQYDGLDSTALTAVTASLQNGGFDSTAMDAIAASLNAGYGDPTAVAETLADINTAVAMAGDGDYAAAIVDALGGGA